MIVGALTRMASTVVAGLGTVRDGMPVDTIVRDLTGITATGSLRANRYWLYQAPEDLQSLSSPRDASVDAIQSGFHLLPTRISQLGSKENRVSVH